MPRERPRRHPQLAHLAIGLHRRVGVIGFCMGGGYALLLAVGWGCDASSVNYGDVVKCADRFLAGACPIVASYGGDDSPLKKAPGRLERAHQHNGVELFPDGHQTVVIEYPDRDAAEAAYNSEESQALVGLRLDAAASGRAVIVAGITPPSRTDQLSSGSAHLGHPSAFTVTEDPCRCRSRACRSTPDAPRPAAGPSVGIDHDQAPPIAREAGIDDRRLLARCAGCSTEIRAIGASSPWVHGGGSSTSDLLFGPSAEQQRRDDEVEVNVLARSSPKETSWHGTPPSKADRGDLPFLWSSQR